VVESGPVTQVDGGWTFLDSMIGSSKDVGHSYTYKVYAADAGCGESLKKAVSGEPCTGFSEQLCGKSIGVYKVDIKRVECFTPPELGLRHGRTLGTADDARPHQRAQTEAALPSALVGTPARGRQTSDPASPCRDAAVAVLSPLQVASSRIRNGEVRDRNRVTVLSTVIGVMLVALTGSAAASSTVKGLGPDGALYGGGYGPARTPAVNVRPYTSTLTITDDRGRNVVQSAGSDSSPSRPASGDYGPKYFFKSDSYFSPTDNNGCSVRQPCTAYRLPPSPGVSNSRPTCSRSLRAA